MHSTSRTGLAEAGVIDDPVLFVAGLWIEDKQHALKAGEYVFAALVTPRGVMEKLVAGDTVVRRLTVTEGMTSAEVVAALNAAPGLEGEIEEAPDEGSLLLETYHYALGDSRTVLIGRMKNDMKRVVDELWQGRDPASASTMPIRRWCSPPSSRRRPASPRNAP